MPLELNLPGKNVKILCTNTFVLRGFKVPHYHRHLFPSLQTAVNLNFFLKACIHILLQESLIFLKVFCVFFFFFNLQLHFLLGLGKHPTYNYLPSSYISCWKIKVCLSWVLFFLWYSQQMVADNSYWESAKNTGDSFQTQSQIGVLEPSIHVHFTLAKQKRKTDITV